MSTLQTPCQFACFVDAENVGHWLAAKGHKFLFKTLEKKGGVPIRRAFGNWNIPALQSAQKSLNIQGFEFRHHYHPVKGKNSADIEMTVDIIETVYRRPEIDTYVIITEDADFSPVFRALVRLNKRVIGVGQQSALSESVHALCEKFWYLNKKGVYLEHLPPAVPSKKTVAEPEKKPKPSHVNAKLRAQYIEFLQQRQWFQVPLEDIGNVYEKLRDCHKIKGHKDMTEYLASQSQLKVKQVRKITAILSRAGLFRAVDLKQNPVQWGFVDAGELVSSVDFAMLMWLWECVSRYGLLVEPETMRKLLYGNYPDEDFGRLFQDTRMAAQGIT